ncbi:hypothetical protein ACFOWA_04700 [Pedobacter lithocola]|uniref:PH domain-containing protein n=1 Tax=Pedobacter lithocola TaxID=1908239 RepID=A0ABV8P5B0_9SPHI
MEFEEKQYLNLWWLYVILAVNAVIVLCIVLFDRGGMSFEDLQNSFFAPIWAVLIPFIILYLIHKNILTTKLSVEGISFRYFPFQRKIKLFRWDEIESVYMNKYDALGDYGGWGVRYRLWFKFDDKAYILNDKNKGLQIEFKNGKRLLFSSNKLEELELFLFNLKTANHIKAIQ